MLILWIFLGAGTGGVLRYSVSNLINKYNPSAFPWATFTVNCLGALVLGCLVAWLAQRAALPLHNHIRAAIGTGLLGGFTTFSTFSVEALALLQAGRHWTAISYIVASVIAGLLAAWLGYSLVRNS